jgi:hypothetical protein
LRRPANLTWPWSHVAEGQRDLRFDLIRGVCVMGMIANHYAGASLVTAFSQSGGMFITPAEGFVFIAGFMHGWIFRGHAAKQGLQSALEKGWGRAATLYMATVAMTFIFGAALYANHRADLLGPVPSWPEFALDVVLLHHTIYMVDVLNMYTLWMGLGVLVLWALAKNKLPYVLGVSLGFWTAYQVDPAWANQFPWPITYNTLFHVSAWQLNFVAGMCLGYYREPFAAWYRRFGSALFAASVAAFGALLYLEKTQGAGLSWLETFSQKSSEGPLRIIACLFVFQLAWLIVTYGWRPVHAIAGWLIVPLGQNSLYVYILHLVIFGIFWSLIQAATTSWVSSTLVQIAAILLIWSLVKTRFLFRVVPR